MSAKLKIQYSYLLN